MQATAAAAGAGVLGAGAADPTAAQSEETVRKTFLDFTNARVQASMNAWERGYRGRADRSLALTDTGVESRHPAVGGWNGVVAGTRDGFETWRHDYPSTVTEPVTDGNGEPITTTFIGVSNLPGDTYQLEVPAGTERITLELEVRPAQLEGTSGERAADVELNEGDTEEVAVLRNETDRVAKYDFVDPSAEYEIFVSALLDYGRYEVTVGYEQFVGDAPSKEPIDDPMAGISADDNPQVVGWNNESPGYHYSRAPRDLDSHGTHVTGIMTGSGRGSAIDPDRSEVEDPRTVLLPGDVLSYEVSARAETGVFASAYGDGIELVIEGPDGRRLARSEGASDTSEESFVNNKTETPTVHGSGEATYTVHVRATEGEALPARVDSVATGAFLHFSETDGDASADGDLALHSGVAPGFSVVGVTDLSTATEEILGAHPEAFARTFNIRAVNMSWGLIGGLPSGTVAGVDPIFGYEDTFDAVEGMAKNGILTVAAAGNDGQPASGNGPPGAANEAVSVVATGPLDGIASYSSGGLGGVDDETGSGYAKPELAAIGGVVPDLDQSALPGDPAMDAPYEDDERFGETRTYSGKGGTSMASPSICGAAGLVSQAMEEDAPAPLSLPTPDELAAMDETAAREWALRVKGVLLATANTTVFNAAPYHRAKAPAYTFGERDPYEGYGRANVGAAIDAVTHDLLADADDPGPGESVSASVSGTVGLDVPQAEQALAGYVRGEGTVDVAVEFSHYDGGNAGMTQGDPHVDLFVYDATSPAGVGGGTATGDPSVVASAQGPGGAASVSFEADPEAVYVVAAKLVNVPGVVNGYEVDAHLDLDVAVEAPPLPSFSASGSRSDDASVFTGGQTDRIVVTLEAFDEAAETVVVRDSFPPEWTYIEGYGDGELVDAEEGIVEFDPVSADGFDGETFTYYVEAPEGLETTDRYTFGPATATIADSGDDSDFSDDSDTFGGTDTNTVVGQGT